ncbi:hypothetical protein, partial [Bacillus cereus]
GDETEIVVAKETEAGPEVIEEFDLPMGDETEMVVAEEVEINPGETEGFDLNADDFDSMIAELQDAIIENEGAADSVQQEKSESYEITLER